MSGLFSARKGIVVLTAVLALAGLLRATNAAAQTQLAVEYYYADWNFYFVTSDPGEIAALDGGAFGGLWKRTGQTFTVWTTSTNGALATCRFFSVSFAPRSSHFYTDRADECAQLKQNPGWQYENIAFYLEPLTATFDCAAGTVILFRLFNNGMGGAPNHRFITDEAEVARMLAAGWSLEGDGPKTAYACVLATVIPGGTAEGLWRGTTSANESVMGLMLDDGTYYLLYSRAGAPQAAGAVQGTSSAINGELSSSDGVDFPIGLSLPGPLSAQVSGSYVSRNSLQLNIAESTGTRMLSATYDPEYEHPPSLAAVAGTYLGNLGHTYGESRGTVVVDSAGNVSIDGQDCDYGGSLAPRKMVNVFDFTIRAPGCPFANFVTGGILHYDEAARQIQVLVPFKARNDMWYFIGTKQ